MKNPLKQFEYTKSCKYTNPDLTYSECSGPGGLRLTEFMAEKMNLRPGARLLDIGIERGYQTCFLAKEYDVLVIGIDPDDDRSDGVPQIEPLRHNACI
jgi:cyclopropane fatty-acyl-phospholipid synthase-like methyltransferase